MEIPTMLAIIAFLSVLVHRMPWLAIKVGARMIASLPMSDKLRIVCIAGPTASGKTALAIRLAKERNGEVISVDSRQVYRTLDIGTEKISSEEMQGVPHHLIDIRDPKETYSAGDFVDDASRLIRDIIGRGKVPILAGGTHFYFDALLYGLPEHVAADPTLRAELERLPGDELMKQIEKRDPRRARMLDPHNRRRLIRALEVITHLGRVPERPREPRHDVEWHILAPERDELKTRIAQRLDETLERGLVDEVRRVRDYVGDTRLNELGLEYRIVGEYLRGERTEEELKPALLSKLYRYAREQEKWLKKLRREAI